MSCYLSIIGKNLDVDAFVERTGVKEFEKRYKDELISAKRNKYSEHSSASIEISNQGFENFNQQVKEAQEFLLKYKDNLKFIAETEGVEDANIRFGMNADVLIEKKNQSFYFPISLIIICAELKISIETTVYYF